jgi:hypothetical protein
MNSTNFDGTSEKFLQWFKSLPGSAFSDDIKIVDLRDRNAGRGISKSLTRLLNKAHKNSCS